MEKKYNLGFIIGKFYPLHKGHQYLIEEGLKQCKQLVVAVCETSDQTILGEVRADWIRELYPEVEVQVRNCDGIDPWNSPLWAGLTIGWLGKKPDVVLTSEEYGKTWSAAIGCSHELVDLKRKKYPVSGTKVREDPQKMWDYLSEPVRAYFTKRVVLVGAESTGKTTLAQKLAKRFKTIWVPEYGRSYAEGILYDGNYGKWKAEEFTHIAKMQNMLEDQLARKANKLLICDTNSLATLIWQKRYVGRNDFGLETLLKGRKIDLYLLCSIDAPFVQDGTRDGEKIRKWMEEEFVKVLSGRGEKFEVLSGSWEEKYNQAVKLIKALR